MYVLFLFSVITLSLTATLAQVFIPVKVFNMTAEDACPSEIRVELIIEEVNKVLIPGLTSYNPVASCGSLPSNSTSGYYWILPPTGPPAVQLYCEFDRRCGCDDGPSTWTRVAFLNMSDPTHVCPSNWSVPNITTDIRACGRGEFNSKIRCNSVYFPSHGIEYSKVCGRIIGYQLGIPEAFQLLINANKTLEENYVDGISLTHGEEGSREHIWTFAGARGENSGISTGQICNCSNANDWPHSTSFVGNDYFCDAGSNNGVNHVFYPNDPLWDG